MNVRLAVALCLAATAVPGMCSAATEIAVSPKRASTDSPLSIKVKAPGVATLRIRVTTKRYGLTFSSSLQVAASNSQWLAVQDPNELLWSVMPTNAPPEKVAFRRDIDLDPMRYTFEAASGNATAVEIIERLALLPDVRRTVIDNGTLVGTLFAAKAGDCRPGVIVLGGSEGGVPEQTAAVLAGNGFATLALAYFNMPGLKKELDEVPIELVQRGAEFMKADPAICHDRPLGILGASKGAELALLAAAKFDDIRAVAVVSPSSVVFSGIGSTFGARSSWSYGGKPLPFANGRIPQNVTDAIAAQENAKSKISYVEEYASMLANNTDPAAVIPVERIAGPILLVAGGDDKLWPSLLMAQQIVSRLHSARFTYAVDLLSYSDAGHPIGIPYQFAAAELAHSYLALGGTPATNESASEDCWPKIIAFFSRALRASSPQKPTT